MAFIFLILGRILLSYAKLRSATGKVPASHFSIGLGVILGWREISWGVSIYIACSYNDGSIYKACISFSFCSKETAPLFNKHSAIPAPAPSIRTND